MQGLNSKRVQMTIQVTLDLLQVDWKVVKNSKIFRLATSTLEGGKKLEHFRVFTTFESTCSKSAVTQSDLSDQALNPN